MKAICLWQPWASLVAIGAKKVETRGWKTSYTGELAIIATAWTPRVALDLARTEPFASAFRAAEMSPSALPSGAVVCVVEVHGYEPTDLHLRYLQGQLSADGAREIAFGDYADGRWAWLLRNARALPHPLPCKGRQGIFDLPTDVEVEVRARMGVAARKAVTA